MAGVERVLRFAKHPERKKNPEWIVALVSSVEGIHGGDLTYLGCSQWVSGAGNVMWYCRKRVGEGDTHPNEVLTHHYRHSGDQCTRSDGISCFALRVSAMDDSGTLEADIWAPSRHLLGISASQWADAPLAERQGIIKDATKRSFHLLIKDMSDDPLIHRFKILFVKPHGVLSLTRYRPSDYEGLSVQLTGLSVSNSSIEDVSKKELDDEDVSRRDSFRNALGVLMDSHERNGQAIRKLQSMLPLLDAWP